MAPSFCFRFLQIWYIHFFHVWKHSQTSLNQGVSLKIKIDLVWGKNVAWWRIFLPFPPVANFCAWEECQTARHGRYLIRWPPKSDLTRWHTRRTCLHFKSFISNEFHGKWLLKLILTRELPSWFYLKLIILAEKSGILWSPRKHLQYLYSGIRPAKQLSQPHSDKSLRPDDFRKAFLEEWNKKFCKCHCNDWTEISVNLGVNTFEARAGLVFVCWRSQAIELTIHLNLLE